MKRGFTLIELLLALALLALMVSLIQGTYSGTVRSREKSGEESVQLHEAALVLDRLATELGAAYWDPNRKRTTGLFAEPDRDGRALLSFTTSLPRIPGIRPGGGIEVTYFVEEDVEFGPRLLRREDPAADGDPEEGGTPYPVLSNVLRFEVSCYDGQQWIDEWDSRERGEEEIPLPTAVEIEISWGMDPETEQVIRTMTPIFSQGR